MGSKWLDRGLTALQRVTVPGMALHVGLRKRYMEDAVRNALAGGAAQVLVLGAGFDTLCLRLAPQFPQALFVEIDHPATHARKVSAVQELAADRTNLRFVAADLGKRRLEDVLSQEPRWRASKMTIAVAEGLLMYLSPDEVRLFLSSCGAVMNEGSELALSHLRKSRNDRIHLGGAAFLTDLSLRAIGEPIRWGVRVGALRELLESEGFTLVDAPTASDLRARYLVQAGLAREPLGDVEHLARARVRARPEDSKIPRANDRVD